jgi:predicted aspartyl protease
MLGAGLCILPGRASAACTINAVFQVPVTLVRGHPVAPVQLNGKTLGFTVDSGASYSSIDQAAAKMLKLPVRMTQDNVAMTGVGGMTVPDITTVEAVTIAGAQFKNMPFFVQPLSGMNLLGQNLLGYADAEYDFPHAAIRLMKPEGCNDANLAYWAGPSQGVSVIHLESSRTDRVDSTIGPATLNGRSIRVVFDTGAQRSVLTLAAAARAGVNPDSPGVVPAGSMYGAGAQTVKLWMATFASFKLGDEEIKNVRLQFGDVQLGGADMLLGDDFFLSHRVYVANSQHKIFITYEGGPVFDLASKPLVQDAPDQTPREAAVPTIDGPEPTDAEGYARRASVYLSRNDLEHGIADLSHAIELAPGDPKYPFQRATARLSNKQPIQAMADLDHTLKLAPRSTPTLLLRARLRLTEHDNAGAVADLNAASAVAAPQDDLRLTLGEQYRAAGRQDLAITQYDQWIAGHSDDGRMAEALFGRCRARAFLGVELDKALADCNRAGSLAPKMAGVLETRAMVRLKTGDYARALTDYDAALAALPTDALALYGRGLTRLRLGKVSEGQADLAAAAAIQPKVAAQAKAFGLSPS